MRVRKDMGVLRWWCALAVMGVMTGNLWSAEIIPVGDFRFLCGQYYYNNTPSSLSGNISCTFVPAIKFSDRFSLIPAYNGSYRGTREVNDLAGGGTLFQDEQSHLLSVKGVYTALPSLKFKLSASYRYQLLRETLDETWGKGLFDYRKANGGFETEYEYVRKHTLRAGVDYFTLQFPNYTSLESSMTAAGLGRELAGTRTLDSVNVMYRLTAVDTFGPVKTETSISATTKEYPDQPLVAADSGLLAEKRRDLYTTAGIRALCAAGKVAGVRLLPGIDVQTAILDSTQNHYDAVKHWFVGDYYDYTAMSVGPSLDLVTGGAKPWVISCAVNGSLKNYAARTVQNAATGAYDSEDLIYVQEIVYSLTVVYPLTKNFKLRMTANLIDATSNMHYETTYAYNYQTSNYLFGFTHEF
jgi:hypothetical protein